MPLLDVQRLRVGFDTEAGLLTAVDDVSFEVEAGRTMGIVGESGCGKTVTASSILRLVPCPPGRMLGGSIHFDGTEILSLPPERLSEIRGKEIAMIFQDPMTSLNPVFTVERQLGEVLKLRFGLTGDAAHQRCLEALQTVGIAEPESRLGTYPHELSGGMKQRVMIAMALLCEPRLLIADEPTTAVDVTIQAQVLSLIKQLQQRTGAAVIYITHDMAVVAETCQEVLVMYAGRIVERGGVVDVFDHPRHPYTRGLLNSMPRKGKGHKGELDTIEGIVPSLLHPPAGCRFADRCARLLERTDEEQRRCRTVDPMLGDDSMGAAACHFPYGESP